MPFNIPNELISQDVYTGCPPGYILVGDACVHPLSDYIINVSEAAEYEFEYYEHGGELIGKYNMRLVGDPPAPPAYFSQNASLTTGNKLPVENMAMNISPDDGFLFFNVTHNHNDGSPLVVIEQPVFSTDADYNNTALFGEFHLLPNNPASIKRVNLNYDILQGDNVYSSWTNKAGANPLPTVKQEETAPIIEWYMGYRRIPTLDRPDEMLIDPSTSEAVTPTIASPVLATDRLGWKTLRSSCYKWTRVYDELNLVDLFGDEIPRSGHYLMQFKAIINKDRLAEFINTNVDSSEYEAETESQIRDYKVLLYPPSLYMYPADAVDNIDSPNLNAINDFLDDIVFEAPRNYKTDGNIHYQIEFLTAKNSTDILFQTSSYSGHDWNEGFQWYTSIDGETWNSFTPSLPTFDNTFNEVNGSDSERVKYIKYELSDEANELLRNRADILFRIKQLDGTLVS